LSRYPKPPPKGGGLFTSPWKDKLNGAVAASWLLQIEKFFRSKSLDGLEYYNYNHKPPGLARTLFGNLGPDYDYFFSKGLLFEIDLLDGFYNFVKRYGEGAVIALIILDTLHDPEQWLEYNSLQYYGEFEFYKTYDFLNMLHLPSLANTSPLEVFLSLGKLADLLPRLNLEKDLRKYQWGFTERNYQVIKKSREELRYYTDKHGLKEPNYWNRCIDGIQKRKELQLLNKLMELSGNPLLQERWWVESGKLIQLYLKRLV
jgi:hypothetical protein